MFAPALSAIELPAELPSTVKLWLLDMQVATEVVNECWPLLSDDEQQRCLRYKKLADRRRFAMTRVALRQLLEQHCHHPADSFLFFKGPHGKPELWGADHPFFNVSHAGRYGLIAISDNEPVGVDIEQVDPSRPLPVMASTVFSRSEQTHCLMGQDVDAFYRIWVGKEALLKSWGWGITEQLRLLEVLPTAGAQLQLGWLGQPLSGHCWLLDAPDGYSAALALGASPPEVGCLDH